MWRRLQCWCLGVLAAFARPASPVSAQPSAPDDAAEAAVPGEPDEGVESGVPDQPAVPPSIHVPVPPQKKIGTRVDQPLFPYCGSLGTGARQVRLSLGGSAGLDSASWGFRGRLEYAGRLGVVRMRGGSLRAYPALGYDFDTRGSGTTHLVDLSLGWGYGRNEQDSWALGLVPRLLGGVAGSELAWGGSGGVMFELIDHQLGAELAYQYLNVAGAPDHSLVFTLQLALGGNL